MQTLLVFLAVATLSVLASSKRLLEAGRFFQLAQLSASGMLFLVLGAAVGPHAGGLLTAEDLSRLRPLTALGLGLGGVLIGLNLDLSLMRRLPRPVYLAALLQSALASVVVAGPLAVLLYFTTELGLTSALGAAVVLGAAASISSGHLAVLWHRFGLLDRLRGLSLSLLAMLDDVTGLCVLAVGLVFAAAGDPATGLGLLCLTVLIGLLCGALVAFLIHQLADGAELMAVLLGGLALVAGAAAYLRLSALLCGLFCGGALALVGGKRVERIYRTLARFERPSYLLLVFLIGAHVDLTDLQAWALLPVFVGLRFVGRILGGDLAARAGEGTLALPPRPGYALLAQGAVSLCILADYLMMVPGRAAQLLFTVGAAGAVVNEILAARTFGRALGAASPAAGAPVLAEEERK